MWSINLISIILCIVGAATLGNHLVAEAEDSPTSFKILNADNIPVTMTRLAASCFENIPIRHRDECARKATEHYQDTRYATKRACCSRWLHMSCIQPFAFNSIYCNAHQSKAVNWYFEMIKKISLAKEGGDCADYPPLEIEEPFLKREYGEIAKCVPLGFQ